jgi:hypothetical protein
MTTPKKNSIKELLDTLPQLQKAECQAIVTNVNPHTENKSTESSEDDQNDESSPQE